MNFSDEQLEQIKNKHGRFDNFIIDQDGVRYFYYARSSIFFSQLYRVFHLMAKELGLKTAVYDYIRKDGQTFLFSKDIAKSDETLLENSDFSRTFEPTTYSDYIHIWDLLLTHVPMKNREKEIEEFYKQWFYAFLIGDGDKQIWVAKNHVRDNYRICECFDFGGVLYVQDNMLEVDNDVYFDEQSRREFLDDPETGCSSEEELNQILEFLIQKEIVHGFNWVYNQNDEALFLIYPHLKKDFIEKCFSVDIQKIMDKDYEHEYSKNFRKVIGVIFDTTRSSLKHKIAELKLPQKYALLEEGQPS